MLVAVVLGSVLGLVEEVARDISGLLLQTRHHLGRFAELVPVGTTNTDGVQRLVRRSRSRRGAAGEIDHVVGVGNHSEGRLVGGRRVGIAEGHVRSLGVYDIEIVVAEGRLVSKPGHGGVFEPRSTRCAPCWNASRWA